MRCAVLETFPVSVRSVHRDQSEWKADYLERAVNCILVRNRKAIVLIKHHSTDVWFFLVFTCSQSP